MIKFAHYLAPYLGIAVGVSAFTFQVKILYPWHKEISHDLNRVEQKLDNIENIFKDIKPK